MAVAWNDGASAAHLQYPTRIVALMMLPMLYPDRAIEELNRASKLPGMRGVYIGTHIDDTHDLDDPLFEPIYSRIEALGLPVFLHPLPNFGWRAHEGLLSFQSAWAILLIPPLPPAS